ncbi:hypothetical protein JHS3_25100 [Jeongeupia sp. HS-3]|uniref:SPOR domain-containing protein n=1 Tax=Jeongeupia sp. HS-3 TaxID=1009682 RepID=UPI0018A6307A|nr:SPOR domain-containing protein [Jeongeupia sp. HS-3]BCL76774.1 hypothetical protein JHS3_25100 [Jeongeupia sp. HS-3]
MNRLIPLLAALSATAVYAEAPQQGRDYYAIQLLSASRPEALQATQATLTGVPHVRVERRGDYYVLRAGFWSDPADAGRALAGLRSRYPQAFVRIAVYRPEAIAAPAPSAQSQSGGGTAQANLLRQQQKPQDAGVRLHGNGAEIEYAEQAALRKPSPRLTSTPVAAPTLASPPPATGKHRNAPDERPLWALLHAGRLAEFDAQLRQTPGWQPSRALRDERQRRGDAATLQAARADGDTAALQALVATRPALASCQHIDVLWRVADAHAAQGNVDGAWALYRPLFPGCQPAQVRIASLQKAEALFTAAQVDALVAIEARDGRRDPASDTEFATLRYQRRLAAWTSGEAPAALADEIRMRRDPAGATRAGWAAFNTGDDAAAQAWFERAIAFGEARSEPLYGLASVAQRQGRNDAVAALLAQPALAADPRGDALLGQLAFTRARNASADKRYHDSQAALAQAQALGVPAEQCAPLAAWNLYGLGDLPAAAEAFEALYRVGGDTASAEGLALSLPPATLRAKVRELGGPLRDYADALATRRVLGR